MSEERSSAVGEASAGMTINRRAVTHSRDAPTEAWHHALAIMNAGEIEDVLGLSTSKELMPIGFGSGKARGKPIFRLDADIRRLATGAATAGVLAALAWFCVVAASPEAVFRRK